MKQAATCDQIVEHLMCFKMVYTFVPISLGVGRDLDSELAQVTVIASLLFTLSLGGTSSITLCCVSL